MLRIISRKAHGIYDYLLGILIFISPWLCGFADARNRDIAVVLGAAIILYSLCTSYELGLLPLVPFAMHLFLDIMIGIFLASAFMHVSMGDRSGLVFAVLGVLMLINAFSAPRPQDTATP